jgi:hypothetical protein
MAKKYFSRKEAEKLLPVIGRALETARQQKQVIGALTEDLSVAAARIMALGGSLPPFAELNRKKAQCNEGVEQLARMIEEIQQAGCLIKDIEMGLVDFPSLREGKEVYLCWKLGEEHIGFWHGTEEDFSARKPLDDSPKKNTPPETSRLQ